MSPVEVENGSGPARDPSVLQTPMRPTFRAVNGDGTYHIRGESECTDTPTSTIPAARNRSEATCTLQQTLPPQLGSERFQTPTFKAGNGDGTYHIRGESECTDTPTSTILAARNRSEATCTLQQNLPPQLGSECFQTPFPLRSDQGGEATSTRISAYTRSLESPSAFLPTPNQRPRPEDEDGDITMGQETSQRTSDTSNNPPVDTGLSPNNRVQEHKPRDGTIDTMDLTSSELDLDFSQNNEAMIVDHKVENDESGTNMPMPPPPPSVASLATVLNKNPPPLDQGGVGVEDGATTVNQAIESMGVGNGEAQGDIDELPLFIGEDEIMETNPPMDEPPLAADETSGTNSHTDPESNTSTGPDGTSPTQDPVSPADEMNDTGVDSANLLEPSQSREEDDIISSDQGSNSNEEGDHHEGVATGRTSNGVQNQRINGPTESDIASLDRHASKMTTDAESYGDHLRDNPRPARKRKRQTEDNASHRILRDRKGTTLNFAKQLCLDKETTAMYLESKGSTELEMPLIEDFEQGHGKLTPKYLTWGRKDVVEERKALKEAARRSEGPLRAPNPYVPEPLKNIKVGGTMPRRRETKQTNEKRVTISKEEREKKKTSTRPNEVIPLPRELRDAVYNYLLVSEKPVAVHDGWKKTYKHGKTRSSRSSSQEDKEKTSTAILRLSSRTYTEAARVLYGQNIFLYLLRDPPRLMAPPPVDVEALVAVANNQNQPAPPMEAVDDPRDEDWNEGISENNTRRSRTRRSKTRNSDTSICIAKYYHLFRHLVIEAEHNRATENTMKCMAEAIKIFREPPPLEEDDEKVPLWPKKIFKSRRGVKANQPRDPYEDYKKRSRGPANIHTLIIKLHPTMSSEDFSFTFTNFFTKSSTIPKEISSLRPQFLNVHVAMSHIGEGPQQKKKVYRLMIDFRHQRILCRVAAGQKDTWAQDKVMLRNRASNARASLQALRDLHIHIHHCCVKHMPTLSGVVEGGGLDEPLAGWEEFEDDGLDFEMEATPQDAQGVTQVEEPVEEVQSDGQ